MIPGIVAAGSRPGVPGGDFPVSLGFTPSITTGVLTSHTVLYPEDVDEGDLLVLIFGAANDCALTQPAGFSVPTKLGGFPSIHVCTRVATGLESGTSLSVTTSAGTKAASMMLRVQAGTASGSIEAAGIESSGSITSPNPPSLSPTWGEMNTLWIAVAVIRVFATATAFPLPDDQASIGVSIGGSGSSRAASIAVATGQVRADALDPTAFTFSAAQSAYAATLALRPA